MPFYFRSTFMSITPVFKYELPTLWCYSYGIEADPDRHDCAIQLLNIHGLRFEH